MLERKGCHDTISAGIDTELWNWKTEVSKKVMEEEWGVAVWVDDTSEGRSSSQEK